MSSDRSPRKRGLLAVLKQTFSDFLEHNCMRMAAALAYYTVFSLPPLLILLITLVAATGLVEPADVEGRINNEIRGFVGQQGVDQVRTLIQNAGDLGSGLVGKLIGLGALLFGATGVVGQLQQALNDTWGVQPDPDQGGLKNFLVKRTLSMAMVLAIAFLLLVSLVLSTVISALSTYATAWLPEAISGAALQGMNLGVSLLIISLLFAAIFKVLPDADIAWRDVAIGALVTAVLFVIGKFAMASYLGSRNMGDTYGAAGSLVLLLLWIYYSSTILLLGAEFTQVYARTRGEGLDPSDGAVRVVQTTERVEDEEQVAATR